MTYIKLIIYTIIYTSLCYSQEWSFAFYNVENLFDTIKNETKDDKDFLPESEREWNTYKYYTKLNKISQVIRTITDKEPPLLVGLCEIENINVLHDLVKRKSIKNHNYIPITFESPDKRGIQTALLYKKDLFTEIESKPISVSIEKDNFYTRDILYVKGRLFNDDTLHIFICHFPSRREGRLESEYKRIHSSELLTIEINKIDTNNPNIIISGDFNDEPFDKSILHIINNSKYKLINTSTEIKGTHIFQGYWNTLDQIIVSENLYNKSSQKQSFIYKNKFLIDQHSKHNAPLPTYRGIFYKGGYSDHFPIFIKFNHTK